MDYILSFGDKLKTYNELMRKLIDFRANLDFPKRLKEFKETFKLEIEDIYAPWNISYAINSEINKIKETETETESTNGEGPKGKKNTKNTKKTKGGEHKKTESDDDNETFASIQEKLHNVLNYLLQKNNFSYSLEQTIPYHFSVFECRIYNDHKKCIGKIIFDCFSRETKRPGNSSQLINVPSMHIKDSANELITCILSMNIELNNFSTDVYFTFAHEVGHCLDWMINCNTNGYFMTNMMVRHKRDVEIPSMCFERHIENDEEFRKKFTNMHTSNKTLKKLLSLLDDYDRYTNVSISIWDALLHGPYEYICYDQIVRTVTESTTIPGTLEIIDDHTATFFRHFDRYGGEYFSYFIHEMT
jgi:hypothetical protein